MNENQNVEIKADYANEGVSIYCIDKELADKVVDKINERLN